jgi:hypothetical protein
MRLAKDFKTILFFFGQGHFKIGPGEHQQQQQKFPLFFSSSCLSNNNRRVLLLLLATQERESTDWLPSGIDHASFASRQKYIEK